MSVAEELVARFTRRGLTLATGESITGGGIAAAITEVAGASRMFRGAIVAYVPEVKFSLAGIEPEVIATFGVVSEQVAIRLAQGAQERCGADYGIGVTGVAGPGPSDGVDAGVVWLAITGPTVWPMPSVLLTARQAFDGDRSEVRAAAVAQALSMLERATSAPTAE